MYIIDYKTKKIAKLNNIELVDFLNDVIKKRYIFCTDKFTTKKVIKYSYQTKFLKNENTKKF